MGGNKPAQIKPAKATSAFSGVQNYTSNLDGIGSSSSRQDGNTLSTNFSLAPGLKSANDTATQGLNNNLGYISQSPTQQLQTLDSGGNSFYNLQSEINKRAATQGLAAADSRFANNGLENSTVRGAFQGQQLTDSILKDLQTRQQSLDYLNTTANQNIGTQQNTIQGLAGLGFGQQNLTNNNFLTGNNSRDQVALANASNQQQAATQNAQLAEQAAASRRALIGNIVASAAAVAAAPLTGGASLGLLAAQAAGGATKAFIGSKQ